MLGAALSMISIIYIYIDIYTYIYIYIQDFKARFASPSNLLRAPPEHVPKCGRWEMQFAPAPNQTQERPTMEWKNARGASSPASLALIMQVPLSMTMPEDSSAASSALVAERS